MMLRELLKNKLFNILVRRLMNTLSQGGFKLSLLVISFVVIYVLLWGYDNPEERDAYK